MTSQFLRKSNENAELITPADNRSIGQKIADAFINNLLYLMILALVIYCLVKYPLFYKNAPIDLLRRTAGYVFMALGVGGVILISGTDLSAGRIMGFTAIIATSLLQSEEVRSRMWSEIEPWPIILVILTVIAVGALVGLFNGFFVAKFKLHPYIVTLATQLIMYGGMLIYLSYGNSSWCYFNLSAKYKKLVAGTPIKIGVWAIPNYVWYAVIIVAIVWLIWNKTSFGRDMMAVGKNQMAAKSAGVNVYWTIIKVFMLAGVLYGISGFVEAARIGGPGAGCGDGVEVDAIAACVMGGVSLVGGKGKVSGIVIGVILLQLISVCFQWMSLSANYVYIIKGALLLMVVSIDMRKQIAHREL